MSCSTENFFESTRISDVLGKPSIRPKTAIPNETRLAKSSPTAKSTDSLMSSQFSPHIKVYLRLKPQNPKSKLARRLQKAMYVTVDSRILITKYPSPDGCSSLRRLRCSDATSKKFKFAKIFNANCRQDEIFYDCTGDTITNFLFGQNSTIMSYGTTNSGKTFTLHGTTASPGIIPRSIESIYSAITCTLSPWYKPINGYKIISLSENMSHFEAEIRRNLLSKLTEKSSSADAWRLLEQSSGSTDGADGEALYSVWLSFFEICNENIYDLLAASDEDNKIPLKLITDKQGKSLIQGLTMISATTGLEAYQVFLTGQSRLTVSSGSEMSSLSHSVFSITLLKYFRECSPDDVEMSTMTFCDLAGAGRSKTNCSTTETRKQERSIKTGLLALGKCLQSVYSCQCGKVSREIIGPFRESKLTRLFQRSLSGREQLTIIANVNPSPEYYVENQSVLHLCSIARKIHIAPEELKKYFTSELSIPSPIMIPKIDENVLEFGVEEDEGFRELREQNFSLQKEIEVLKSNASARELEIREEMTNFCTEIIEEMEVNWRMQFSDEAAKNRGKLPELSLINTFQKKHSDSLRSRKRRRVEYDVQLDENKLLCILESENARITLNYENTRKALENLKKECEVLRVEKSSYSFELSLANEEFNETRRFLISEADATIGNGSLLDHLKLVIRGKNERIKALEESLSNARKYEKHEEIEAENSGNDSDNLSELSSIFVGESIRSNSSDSSSEDTIEPEESSTDIRTLEKSLNLNNVGLEKTSDQSIFESINKTLNSPRIYGHGDSGIAISSAMSLNTGTTFVIESAEKSVQVSDSEKHQEQKRMIEDRVEKLKSDYKRLQSDHHQGSIRINELSRELDDIRRMMDSLKEAICKSDQKIVAYQLLLASQDVELESLKECNIELKSELSRAHLEQEKSSLKCTTDHLPKMKKLQQELVEKTEEIASLNSKLARIEQDFKLLNNLSGRVSDFGDIIEKFRKEKVELRQELQERTLSQSSLECRLKLLSSRVQNRENEITSLRTDLAGIAKMNTANSERANELSQDIANAVAKLTVSKEKMRRSEIERRQLECASSNEISNLAACFERNTEMLSMIHEGDDNTRSELDRMKLLISKKEREMGLLKKNRDSTIRRYELLVRKLQGDVERNNRELLRVKGYPRCTMSKESLESVEQESSKKVHRDSMIKARSSKRTSNIKNRRAKHHCRLTCSARRLSSQIVASLTSLDGSKSNNCEVLNAQKNPQKMKNGAIQILQADHRAPSITPDETSSSVTLSSDDSGTDYKEFSKWMRIKNTNGRTQFVIRQAEITVENSVRSTFSED